MSEKEKKPEVKQEKDPQVLNDLSLIKQALDMFRGTIQEHQALQTAFNNIRNKLNI